MHVQSLRRIVNPINFPIIVRHSSGGETRREEEGKIRSLTRMNLIYIIQLVILARDVLVKVPKAPNRIAKYDNGGVRDREPTSLYDVDFYDPLSAEASFRGRCNNTSDSDNTFDIFPEAMDPLCFLFSRETKRLEFDPEEKHEEILLPINQCIVQYNI